MLLFAAYLGRLFWRGLKSSGVMRGS
jgi:hypothetical protein